MDEDRSKSRREAAARQWNEHENRGDGNELVESLDRGLTVLADLLYSRLHKDVEDSEGLDSMLTPISPSKTQSRGLREINLYQVAESAALARSANYVRDDGAWYVQWLSRLRLADPPPQGDEKRANRGLSGEERRATAAGVYQRVGPRGAGVAAGAVGSLLVDAAGRTGGHRLGVWRRSAGGRGADSTGRPPAGHRRLPAMPAAAAAQRRTVSPLRQSALGFPLADLQRVSGGCECPYSPLPGRLSLQYASCIDYTRAAQLPPE